MATIPNGPDMTLFEAWVEERPEVIQKLCAQCPPDRLYLMDSGHRCTLHSYMEDGTLVVNVTGEFNSLTFERRVFGITPESLVECDLPGPDEELGAELTDPEEIKAFIAFAKKEKKDDPVH